VGGAPTDVAMIPAPTVSVIVPHYNDLPALDICLQSLTRQTYPADRLEIVVADNGSPQGVGAVGDLIGGRAKLVSVTERGAGPARNGAVAASAGTLLAFIDSDCIAEPEWVAQGVAGLDRFDFVGGRVKVGVRDPARMTPSEAFERVFAFDFETYINKKGFTGAGNLFCTRAVFDDVGGFRATVSEDVEWSHRARGKGWRLGYAPAAIVTHPARQTWPELKRKWRRITAESYALARENQGGRLGWLLRVMALPASAVFHTPKVLRSGELHGLDQRLAALETLYRLRFWRAAEGLRLLTGAGG